MLWQWYVVTVVCITLPESRCLVILMYFKQSKWSFQDCGSKQWMTLRFSQQTHVTPFLFVKPRVVDSYYHACYYLNISTNNHCSHILFILFRPTQSHGKMGGEKGVSASESCITPSQSVTWHERKEKEQINPPSTALQPCIVVVFRRALYRPHSPTVCSLLSWLYFFFIFFWLRPVPGSSRKEGALLFIYLFLSLSVFSSLMESHK